MRKLNKQEVEALAKKVLNDIQDKMVNSDFDKQMEKYNKTVEADPLVIEARKLLNNYTACRYDILQYKLNNALVDKYNDILPSRYTSNIPSLDSVREEIIISNIDAEDSKEIIKLAISKWM